ncbi:MAG TPA: DinB family protein [Pirellulales bacterium]|nr:DinB family protein [Pirellulales bacterium]
MSRTQNLIDATKAARTRTLATLDAIEKLPNPSEALGYRPGPGRAHLAWQLMHIGITEEIFATERLDPEKQRAFEDLWPRFRGGSTPDDQIPTATEIRHVLDESRAHLLATLSKYDDSRLGEIPATLQARNLTVLDVLHILGWHEAHHQGQAHLTLNLYKATHELAAPK